MTARQFNVAHNFAEPNAAPPGFRLAQLAVAKALALHDRQRGLLQVAENLFGHDAEAIAVARASAGVADTSTAGWAMQLLASDTQALVQSLASVSVFARLASEGLALQFDGAGVVVQSVPVDPARGPAWIGEAGVIPLVMATTAAQRIAPNKLAGIIGITEELSRSSGAVEIFRRLLRGGAAALLDSSLLDSAAAVPGVRPAGLLHGVTLTPGSTAGGTVAMGADLQTMVTAMLAAGVAASNVVVIANSATVAGVNAATRGQPGFVLVGSPYLAADVAIAVDADSFVGVADPLELDVSKDALLTLADAGAAAPTQAMSNVGGLGTALQVLPDRGVHVAGGVTGAATAGAQALSLWQTWSLGIRLVLPCGYSVTAGAVQGVDQITWTGVATP